MRIRVTTYRTHDRIRRENGYLIVTQETLIQQIAEKENIDAATVRKIIKSAEDIVFDYLSSMTPSENITLKLFHGISIDRKYVDKKNYSKGMFQNITCPAHVKVKANSSKYYGEQVNQRLFSK